MLDVFSWSSVSTTCRQLRKNESPKKPGKKQAIFQGKPKILLKVIAEHVCLHVVDKL